MTYTFAKSKFPVTEKLTNGALVTPTPGGLWSVKRPVPFPCWRKNKVMQRCYVSWNKFCTTKPMTKTYYEASPVRMGGNLEIYKFTFASPGVSIGNEWFREISSTILNEWMSQSIVFFLGSCTNSNYIPPFMDFRSAIKFSSISREKLKYDIEYEINFICTAEPL